MKIRLGSTTIDPTRAQSIRQIDALTYQVNFVTGDAIRVRSGVKEPSHGFISFPGTPADLKSLLRGYIYAHESDDDTD